LFATRKWKQDVNRFKANVIAPPRVIEEKQLYSVSIELKIIVQSNANPNIMLYGNPLNTMDKCEQYCEQFLATHKTKNLPLIGHVRTTQ
jgi:hypothetical protein